MPMPEIKHFFYGRCSLCLCVFVNPPTGSCPSRACRSWDPERRHPSFFQLTSIWNKRKKYLEFWGSGINLKKSSVWIDWERSRMPSISSSLYSKAKATSIGLILTSADLFWPLLTFFTSGDWAGLNLIWHCCRKGSIKWEISYTIPIDDKFENVLHQKTSQLQPQ